MTIQQSALTTWTPKMVVDADDQAEAFLRYLHQEIGVWSNVRDTTIFRKAAKQFFEQNPTADWYTMCRIVRWAKIRRKRFTRAFKLVEAGRDAWVQGFLPELDPQRTNEQLEEEIAEALQVEQRDEWRRMLIGATGIEARSKILAEWRESHEKES